MITDEHSENRACTKAMAAIEARFSGVRRNTAVITQAEFQAISNYIETLEYDLCGARQNIYWGD